MGLIMEDAIEALADHVIETKLEDIPSSAIRAAKTYILDTIGVGLAGSIGPYVEELVSSLGLPYRILRLCAGDLGFTSAITYDFEVYAAGQEKWLEVSSVSNFESYQANRLKLRYKSTSGKKKLAHTLNGSALAIPRILAAVLENNQSEYEITIPEVLRPYTGFDSIRK